MLVAASAGIAHFHSDTTAGDMSQWCGGSSGNDAAVDGGAHRADDVRLHGRAPSPVPARGAPMKIRQAKVSDADEIARIINAAFEIEREFRRGERTSPPEVLISISEKHGIFLVAEDEGRLLGAVEVRVEGDAGYFVAVDASVRRGGIGRALVEAAEAHCRGA